MAGQPPRVVDCSEEEVEIELCRLHGTLPGSPGVKGSREHLFIVSPAARAIFEFLESGNDHRLYDFKASVSTPRGKRQADQWATSLRHAAKKWFEGEETVAVRRLGWVVRMSRPGSTLDAVSPKITTPEKEEK
jgi:hypothetical protein